MIQKLFNVVFPLLFHASFLLPQKKNVSLRRFKSLNSIPVKSNKTHSQDLFEKIQEEEEEEDYRLRETTRRLEIGEVI